MFALLIWDDVEKRLFAARDRFGIKPLYFAIVGNGVAFASEIKQLHGLPGLPARMNLPRVHDFLTAGLTDHTAETLFDGVQQLRGGECATVDADRRAPTMRLRRWYQVIQLDQRPPLSGATAAEQFRALLTDAVRLHLRADVPVGSCLSGGLDSSSIVCLMSRVLDACGGAGRVRTISACYDEARVNEKSFMDAVVAHADTEPSYVYPRADDVFARIADVTWHQDEPFGSTSIFAQWCVFEEAKRKGLKVMLDGQGADEQLAGYYHNFPVYIAQLIRHGRLLSALHTMQERRRVHGASFTDQAKRVVLALLPAGRAASGRAWYRSAFQHDWLAPEFWSRHRSPDGAEAAAVSGLGLPAITDIATLCVAQTYASSLQMLLRFEDRSSMAHSIEARVPFVDHELVEFSLQLGNSHKIDGAETKQVLRRAMSGILPDMVRDRRDKLGFATPEEEWFRGPLKRPMRDAIEATLARYPALFNATGVRRLAGDMLDGKRALDHSLWRIVSLGLWGERFGLSH
jgi:asparagine synthase (glutamine-hydrolysing)